MTSWIFPVPSDDADEPVAASDVLSITLEMHDANTVVLLDGPVCAYTAPHLDAELHQIEAVDRRRLVIDASRVHTMSSDGLRVLTEHAERCEGAGGELVVRDPSPVTVRVLEICRLNRLIAIDPRLGHRGPTQVSPGSTGYGRSGVVDDGRAARVHIEEEVLHRTLEQLRRTQTEGVSLTDAMEHLAQSVTAMFGLTGSGLMLIDDDQLLHSVLATDDLGWELEHAQEKAGEGPCVDTLVYGHVVSTPDVREDDRWPELLGELDGSALGGVLGVPIALGGATVGALNVYVDAPHDWDDSDRHALTAFGSILESLLATALFAEQRETLVAQLQQALDSRVLIERCVGLLMGRHELDAVSAFNRLRGDARAQRRRVHDLASKILAENE